MYFAQDPTDIAAVLAALAPHMAARDDLFWAALVDSAFDHGTDAPAALYPGINCYAGDVPLDDLTGVSPRLVPIHPESKELAGLLGHCSGRPMLSVVASTLPLRDLAARWLPLHWAHAPDRQRMLLRIADTRVLAGLPSILDASQWTAFAAPFAHWFYIDRSGKLAECSLPAPGPDAVPTALDLSQAQLDAFTEACEPDAALDFLADHTPDVFPASTSRAGLYAYIRGTFQLANEHHIESWTDKIALVTAELLTRGEVRRHPGLEPLLRSKAWAPGKLGEALADHGLV